MVTCLNYQVIAAAQAGKHNDKRESYGDTLIIDPWGTVVGRLPGKIPFLLHAYCSNLIDSLVKLRYSSRVFFVYYTHQTSLSNCHFCKNHNYG